MLLPDGVGMSQAPDMRRGRPVRVKDVDELKVLRHVLALFPFVLMILERRRVFNHRRKDCLVP